MAREADARMKIAGSFPRFTDERAGAHPVRRGGCRRGPLPRRGGRVRAPRERRERGGAMFDVTFRAVSHAVAPTRLSSVDPVRTRRVGRSEASKRTDIRAETPPATRCRTVSARPNPLCRVPGRRPTQAVGPSARLDSRSQYKSVPRFARRRGRRPPSPRRRPGCTPPRRRSRARARSRRRGRRRRVPSPGRD